MSPDAAPVYPTPPSDLPPSKNMDFESNFLPDMSRSAILGWGIVVIVGYNVCVLIYNLFFHPLKKFPGPKLAAASHAYEFYYDVILHGRYMWEIQRMHEKYGPVVRITPRELHFNDPAFYDEIYAGGGRIRHKDPKQVPVFSAPLSMLATVDHHHHRLRRSILNSFFSKQSVVKLEPIIQEKVDKLVVRFIQAHSNGVVIAIDDAFSAVTADVISHYAYGKSFDYLDDPTFNSDVRRGVNGLTHMVHFNRHFPLVFGALKKLPRTWIQMLRPAAGKILDTQDSLTKFASEALGLEGRSPATKERETIFEAMSDPSLPYQERSVKRLTDEALIVIGAGTETTARVLTVITYHLLANRPILLRLRGELKQVMLSPEDRPTWSQLEKLPYLIAVINEGLRLAFGLTMRLPRIAPTETLVYHDWVIPPGTPMTSGSVHICLNPTLFSHPISFNPDRWIEAAAKGENLSSILPTFGKGSRICIGKNLAYAELYLVVAVIVRRFELELFDSSIKGVWPYRDLGLGFAEDDSFGVNVVVKAVLTE